MPSLLMLTIAASTLTVVSDWAAWHYVWRHENTASKSESNKRSITSLFLSYYLPLMPTLAVLLGPAKLGVYNAGFAHVASIVLFTVLAIVTGGVAASAWSENRKQIEERDSRKLIDQEDALPEHASQHILWTTIMLACSSIFWIYLLIF